MYTTLKLPSMQTKQAMLNIPIIQNNFVEFYYTLTVQDTKCAKT